MKKESESEGERELAEALEKKLKEGAAGKAKRYATRSRREKVHKRKTCTLQLFPFLFSSKDGSEGSGGEDLDYELLKTLLSKEEAAAKTTPAAKDRKASKTSRGTGNQSGQAEYGKTILERCAKLCRSFKSTV